MYRLEVASQLNIELETLWRKKIANEFGINTSDVTIAVNSDLILGYKLFINDKIYDHSFKYCIDNDLAIINKKLNQ
jgi:F0F1-type ATP synthase delta subunit